MVWERAVLWNWYAWISVISLTLSTNIRNMAWLSAIITNGTAIKCTPIAIILSLTLLIS